MERIRITLAALAVYLGATLSAVAAPQLVMVERDGCHWCETWNEVIGPIYPLTPEGKFAPLQRADIHDGAPDGMQFARAVSFTPTFILMEEGDEIGRIEGYPGEDLFWMMLEKLLKDKTDYGAGS